MSEACIVVLILSCLLAGVCEIRSVVLPDTLNNMYDLPRPSDGTVPFYPFAWLHHERLSKGADVGISESAADMTPCMRWTKSRRSKICVRYPEILWIVTHHNITVKKGYNAYVRWIRRTSLNQSSR